MDQLPLLERTSFSVIVLHVFCGFCSEEVSLALGCRILLWRSLCFPFIIIVIFLYTVGKHIPCGLSIAYTSYIRYGVRAAPKFGKHVRIFSYHKKNKISIAYHMQRNITVLSSICKLENIC